MKKKVSIIVPAFNCEKYIEESLNSLISQSYLNIEIIVINDGSKDNTLNICEKMKQKDKRIIVFDNKNHGVSYSRNFGIKNSNGEYLTFVDADDIVDVDFIVTLVSNIEKYNADCSVIGITSFKNTPDIDKYGKDVIIFRENDLKNGLFDLYGGFLANKMYKREIIEKNAILLDEKINISEDLLFNLEYLNFCKRIVYSTKNRYFYRIHNESSYYNFNNVKWFSVFDTYSKIINNGIMMNGIEDEVYYNFLMAILEGSYRVKKLKNADTSLEEKIADLKKKYFKKHYNFNFKQRFKLFLFYNFPNIVMWYKRQKVGGE